jgi:hypothetical protein
MIPQQVEIPLKRQAVAARVLRIGHEPALHQDLRAADVEQLFDLLADLLKSQDVRTLLTRLAVEVAEDALGGADVRVVDVAVDHIRAIRLGMHLHEPVKPHAVPGRGCWPRDRARSASASESRVNVGVGCHCDYEVWDAALTAVQSKLGRRGIRSIAEQSSAKRLAPAIMPATQGVNRRQRTRYRRAASRQTSHAGSGACSAMIGLAGQAAIARRLSAVSASPSVRRRRSPRRQRQMAGPSTAATRRRDRPRTHTATRRGSTTLSPISSTPRHRAIPAASCSGCRSSRRAIEFVPQDGRQRDRRVRISIHMQMS